MAGRASRAQKLVPSFLMVAGALACGNVHDDTEIVGNPPPPGGSAGVGGTGGSGGSTDPGCPAQKPAEDASCDTSVSCSYPGVAGPCGPPGATAKCIGKRWRLETELGFSCNPPIPVPCPATAPVDGAECHVGFNMFPAVGCHYESPTCADAVCTDVWHVTSCVVTGEAGAGGQGAGGEAGASEGGAGGAP
jgi:hypothetical protein